MISTLLPRGLQNIVMMLLLLIVTYVPGAYGLPQDVSVTHGQLVFSQNESSLDISQSTTNAIANWQSFSINTDEIVNVHQPDANAALLNRVVGADPSNLLGQINSNGRVFLINPNGIVVGEDASINVGEFIAATLDISDEDFLNGGDLEFYANKTAGIVNLGSITSANGDLVLIASSIENHGELHAANGQVALGAGGAVYLTSQDNQRLIVKSDLSEIVGGTGIENTGVIDAAEAALIAAGGDIYDLAINQSGLIKATGIENRDGRILLTSSQGAVSFSGQATAKNADGSGGVINIGGGLRGADIAIANAAITTVANTALIDVSSESGDAGEVIVWADQRTDFAGTVTATAVSDSANGGFVEVSGKRELNFTGLANLLSEKGEHGTLLLDPDSITVQTANPGSDPNIVEVSTLEAQLAAGNVVLDASTLVPASNGNITINDAVSWAAATNLELNAANDISINASLTGPAGNIEVNVGYVDFSGTTANLLVDSAATITANALTLTGGEADLGGNSPDGQIGSIVVNGVLNVSTLDVRLPTATFGMGGVEGDVTIANPLNQIAMLTNSGGENFVGGSLTIVDGSGNLDVSGDFSVSGGDVMISTAGDLTLASGTTLVAGGAGANLFVSASGGSFTNNAGAAALSATGRFLIYSDTPDNTTLGGLVATPAYNKTLTANPPASITQTGDRVLYSLAPTLLLTASDLTRLENEANPALTFAVTGLVGGDAPGAVFSGAPLLSTTAVLASPLGTYPISITNGTIVLSDYDYAVSFVPGDLTIGIDPTRLLTVTADNLTRIYGDANPDFTATITGFRAGDDASVVSGLQFMTAATPQSPVGTYTITPFGASAANYTFSFVPGTLTVDFRDLTITADSLNKIFGTEPAALGVTPVGLAPFDSLASIGTIVTTSAGLTRLANVGSYAVVPSGVTNPNYNVTYVNGTVNVTAAPLTLTTNNASRAYGTANPLFMFSLSGLVSGDSLDTTGLVFNTSATVASDVGDYSVIASGVADPNYDITFVAGSLEILAAQLTITADSYTRDYGSANPLFTFSTTGLLAGDTLGDVVSDVTLTSSATQSTSVGNYPIIVSGTQVNPNYTVVYAAGTLAIEKVDLNLFLELGSRLYGDPNPTPEVRAIGLVNGDTSAVLRNVVTQTLASEGSDVGSYPVLFQAASATNYNIVSINSGVLNVLPRPLTIIADSFTREYGDPNPDFTATFVGLADIDDESVITGLEVTTVATIDSNVLDYGITPSSNPNNNYDISYQQGTLSITPVPLTIEIGDFNRFYGQVTETFNPSVDFFDLLKLDDLPSELGFRLETGTDLTSDAGQYPITASLTSINYVLDIRREGVLTIAPAPLDITLFAFGRVYGEEDFRDFADPAVSGLRASGLMLADRVEDVVSVSNPTTLTTDVGVYDLELELLTGNYFLASVTDGTYFVQPRQIAIKPDNIVRFYGDPDPEITYLVGGDGLASFDTLESVVFVDEPLITGSFGIQAPAGTRTILAQLTGNPNYVVANREGYYAVLPRPVELSVANAEAFGGQPLPDFVAEATNLAPFDTVDTAFPDLVFRVTRENEPGPVQAVLNIEDFIIPVQFQNETFFASYPSSIEAPEEPFDSTSDVTVSPITPIEIDFPEDTSGGTVLSTIAISSSLFTPAEQEADEPVVQYVHAIASNPNYVVVSNTSGELLWSPNPELVAQRRELEAEQTLYNNAYDAFWNADEVYGLKGDELVIVSGTSTANNNVLNVPRGAEQTVMEAIGQRLLTEAASGDDSLATLIAKYGSDARGTAAFAKLTGGAYSDFDTLAFLQAARTDPDAAEILAEIYSDYVISLIDRDSHSPAQSLVIAQLNEKAASARDAMANSMEAKYNAWLESPQTQAKYSGLSSTFGVDVPYADFMGEAAGDYIEATTAGYIAGAVAGGVAATAAVTSVIGATGAIFPFAMSASAVAASTTGASALSIAGGTAATVSTAAIAGPAVIIGVAVAGSIARGVQVFEEAAQKENYDSWLEGRGSSFDVTSLELENDKGEPNPVDNAILLSAITSMLAGS